MDFRQTLEAAGLLPMDIEPDGEWHRCRTMDKPKKRNGSFRLAICGSIGLYRNFATMDAAATWKASGDFAKLDSITSRERVRAAKEEDQRRRYEAAKAMCAYWRECQPLRGGHPYLERKLLDVRGCNRLRVDRNSWLVVPVFADGKLISVQRISSNGKKLFWKDCPTDGGYFVIGEGKEMTVFCEGLATGLVIYQSVPNCRVIVTFSAANLIKVAQRLRVTGLAMVAADNDHETEAKTGRNPGIEYAKAAAEAIGCGVAWPEGINGTDYADMFVEAVEAITAANESAMSWAKLKDFEIRRRAANAIERQIVKAMRTARPPVAPSSTCHTELD